MKILFWGKYVSFHQLESFELLERKIGQPITYLLVDADNSRRTKQGWKPIRLGKGQLFQLHEHRFFRQSINMVRKSPDAVHIFLSLWGDKRLFLVMLYALWKKARVMVILEPYSISPVGYWKEENQLVLLLKIIIRKLAYRFSSCVLWLVSRNQLPCMLAVSQMANRQLVQAGFSKKTIFPYAYFVKKQNIGKVRKKEDDHLHLIYSSSLIKRKGLDILLEAIKAINKMDLRIVLDIYGSGDIHKFRIEKIPGVRYLNSYQPEDAQQIIGQYDLLVLPSRHDGWGVVVNEALMQNVPVITSDQVGAKCLIETSGAGLIFENENVAQLINILNELFENRKKLQVLKSNCKFIINRILPEVGADYLEQTIQFYFFKNVSRPFPVWLSRSRME